MCWGMAGEVSDKVRLISKLNDDEQYVLESGARASTMITSSTSGSRAHELTEMLHGEIKRGTNLICYLIALTSCSRLVEMEQQGRPDSSLQVLRWRCER